MSRAHTIDDDVAFLRMIQEVSLPISARKAMSPTRFTRSLDPGANRREAPRVDLADSGVVIEVEDAIVRPVDFSVRGVQFQIDSRLVPGSPVMMRIRQRDESSAALGRVMWSVFERSAPQADPHYRVGVVLENTDIRVVRSILARCGLDRRIDVHMDSSWTTGLTRSWV